MTLEQIREMETLKKRLKKCQIYVAVYITIGFLIAMIAAIEFKVIQDMACDMNLIVKMHNQKNHQVNALLAKQITKE